MALARLKRTTEETLNDHNCAFNAFALGLCDPIILNQIEHIVAEQHIPLEIRFNRFISLVAESLHINPKWNVVKAELLKLKNDNKTKFQKIIARVLRTLTTKLAQKNADFEYHFQESLVVLMSAYGNYRITQKARECEDDYSVCTRHSVIQQRFEDLWKLKEGRDQLKEWWRAEGHQWQGSLDVLLAAFRSYRLKQKAKECERSDDICKRHSFIENKFAEFWKLNTDNKEIESWWRKEGYHLFLAGMDKDGAWAGDLELSRLARYFGVVLNVVRQGLIYTIYGNYGYFPYLHGNIGFVVGDAEKGEIMHCLFTRGVLERETRPLDAGIAFNLSALSMIEQRLNCVPDYILVKSCINNGKDSLKGMRVPAYLSRECLDELLQRSVICTSYKDPRETCMIFNVDAEIAKQAIDAVPCLEAVMNICRKNFKEKPLLVLSNQNEQHFDNTVSLIPSEEPLDVQRPRRASSLINSFVLMSGIKQLKEASPEDQSIVSRLQ